MGLLKNCRILSWEETVDSTLDVKKMGLEQFKRFFLEYKEKVTECRWGYEMEVMLCGQEDGRVKLLLASDFILENIMSNEVSFLPEYAAYMVEMIPKFPLMENLSDLLSVESSLEIGTKDLEKALSCIITSGFVLKITALPSFGTAGIYISKAQGNKCTCYMSGTDGMCRCMLHKKSIQTSEICEEKEIVSTTKCPFVSEEIFARGVNRNHDISGTPALPNTVINKNERFSTFTLHTIKRRGKKLDGLIKVFEDSETVQKFLPVEAFGIGMGCTCAQVTFQNKNLDEARYIYDQFAILSPLFLRLTRATPTLLGHLLETETRWEIIAKAVDDRRTDEKEHIPKSRYSSVDLFISNRASNLPEYNDIQVPINQEAYESLIGDVDEKLARHIASLFVRDPLLLYEGFSEKKNLPFDPENRDEFENIQTSNWRSVRFKLPGKEKNDGWKVEIRTMEVSTTSFEAAALSVFVFLLGKTILKYNLNFYIPISKVDLNFEASNKLLRKKSDYKKRLEPDTQQFFYRENIKEESAPKISKGTLQDIFLGKNNYPGILPFVKEYTKKNYNSPIILKYLDFIERKINNEYLASSDFIRKFIFNHGEYKNDSIVSPEIEADLIKVLKKAAELNDISYLKN